MKTLAHLFAVFPELAKSRRARKEQAGTGEKKRNGKLIYVILGILVGVTLLLSLIHIYKGDVFTYQGQDYKIV